jgi:hypothetical protein
VIALKGSGRSEAADLLKLNPDALPHASTRHGPFTLLVLAPRLADDATERHALGARARKAARERLGTEPLADAVRALGIPLLSDRDAAVSTPGTDI